MANRGGVFRVCGVPGSASEMRGNSVNQIFDLILVEYAGTSPE